MARKSKSVVGWREWVSLPGLGVGAIRAKIDTGARSAALHAFGLEVFEDAGSVVARFAVHPDHRGPGPASIVAVPVHGERIVRNPGGRRETRPVIHTQVRIGEVSFEAEITLTRRDEMGFPMLLGRQAIRKHFLVDPGRSYLLGSPPPQ